MPKLGMEPIRRKQIRRAAARVIAKKGFRLTTVREIAAKAKVSTGTLSYYYSDKSDLLLDAFFAISEWFQARVKRTIETAKTPRDAVKGLVEASFENSNSTVSDGQAMWLWATSEALMWPKMAELINQRRKAFQEILIDLIRQLDADDVLTDSDIASLAAEYDAFLNGISAHVVTGGESLDTASIERSLILLVDARVACAQSAKAQNITVTKG